MEGAIRYIKKLSPRFYMNGLSTRWGLSHGICAELSVLTFMEMVLAGSEFFE